jgi:putative ABC transport system substrate-binding protein
MRRRDALSGLGAVVAWPLAARAQQAQRLPVVGVLTGLSEADRETKDRDAALDKGLRQLGWTEGGNFRLVRRASGGDRERLRAHAAELAALAPDVLVAYATTALAALQRATNRIPIVFVQVTDPVGAGFVKSLARPGGNITGFTQHEFSIGVKWLELLKELAPSTGRVAVLYDPENPASAGYLSAIHAAAGGFRVTLTEHAVRDDGNVEQAVATLAGAPGGGLIVLPGPGPSVRRDLVIALAARHRIPAVYPFRYWVARGGLATYGIDNIDLYRRAAAYVDRILNGETPSGLAVQHAVKFQLIVNGKTAKTLGLELALPLLARTDEVIE